MLPLTAKRKIALIAMPWHDPYLPSIQLAALKAYVERVIPSVIVDLFPLYFTLEEAIGLDTAQAIWQPGGLVAEAIFAYHLFPEKASDITAFLKEQTPRLPPPLRELNFVSDIINPIGEATCRHASTVEWSEYILIGFSLVFAQTMASLFMAELIKEQTSGDALVVAGGPNCTGQLGLSLLKKFPHFDLIVNGEGELPLSQLVKSLVSNNIRHIATLPGLISRYSDSSCIDKFNELPDLGSLPIPDHRAYFRQVDAAASRSRVYANVAIPVESSRGCWWDRTYRNPMLACSFCSLNRQWVRYREKTVDKFVAELASLSERHDVRGFLLVDNSLRPRNIVEMCEKISALTKDLRWAIEARVSVTPRDLLCLRRAGVFYVQFGIEALSTEILKLMHKGTTCIQNIQAMKFCCRFGVATFSNLLIRHPGVSAAALDETLQNIESVTCYPPLNISEFTLGYGSPIYKNPKKFSVRNIRNLDDLARCIPSDYYRDLVWPSKSFDVDEPAAISTLWSRVEERVASWRTLFERQTCQHSVSCLLLYEEIGEGLRVTDYRISPPKVVDLDGPSRNLYLACEETTSTRKLMAMFPQMSGEQIKQRLEWLFAERLIYQESGCYLSLAIPSNPFQRTRLVEPSEKAAVGWRKGGYGDGIRAH